MTNVSTLERLLPILIGALLYIIIKYFVRSVCWKHFRWKRLKPYEPFDGSRFCSKCLEREANPKIRCSCGWKGRFLDLLEYSFNEDTKMIYHCPDCEKEIKF